MTQYLSLTGTIEHVPKVLRPYPLMLYVSIRLSSAQTVHCLVTQHSLDFLYRAQHRSRIAVYGHYNQRHQFVINKYLIQSTAA